MSFTYNKRMSNYHAMLPLTPHNYRLAQHTIRGGDLTVQTTAPVPLPETINDWLNMNDDDLHKLTPVDINSLSIASFKLAFCGIKPFYNLIIDRLLTNNPNHEVIYKAIDNRRDIILGRSNTIPPRRIVGGDLTATPATPATPALPETAQDWQNMTDDELLKITPDDILNNISEASFRIAFREASTANPHGSFALANAIKERLFNNLNGNVNPNKAALIKAVLNRWELMSWWVAPDDPLFNTTLQGVPKWWFKHYNPYSWVKSQVIMYGTYEDFQNTSFYKKYNTRIISIQPPRNFARYMSGSIPGQERKALGGGDSGVYLHNIFEKYGQKWRVMFIQGDMTGHLSSGNDYYVYYIDCTGLTEYLDMLNDFYDDRDTLQPNEIIIMLHLQYLAAVKQHERDLLAQGYSEGEAAQKAADEAAQETSEDNSSDIWGDIKDGLEIGAMFI